MSDTTPMMLQYTQIKEQHKDCVLFFRLGDFYEMFEQDATEAASILDITLTQRNGIPMCGIPYHAAQGHIARLIKAGRKVAICEQTALSKPGQGIAKREVVQIITPGTVIDEDFLDRNTNNYLLCLATAHDEVSLAYLDLSTAEFSVLAFPFAEREDRVHEQIVRLSPREILVQESLYAEDDVIRRLLTERSLVSVNRFPDWRFDPQICQDRLQRHLGVASLRGFGLHDDAAEIPAAGVILEYVTETSKTMVPHITNLQIVNDSSYLGLDESTQKNLELVRNLQDGSSRYTLLEVIDHTRSAMGCRYLRRVILQPLRDRSAIEARLNTVEFFYKHQILLSSLREALRRILDLERLSTKVSMDRAHARDLLGIKVSIRQLGVIHDLLADHGAMHDTVCALAEAIAILKPIEDLLERALAEDAPVTLAEGNLIKSGFDEELDRLRAVKEQARQILEEYLVEERKRTAISSLKLRHNRILGYFLEVTKPNVRLVPEHFIRKQSLVGSERYTSEALLDKETQISGASERIVELERELFLSLRAKVRESVSSCFAAGRRVAEVDVLQSFAFAATVNGYTRPVFVEDGSLEIVDGRHPVVEAHLPSGSFVPNSLNMHPDSERFALLTGPNMAGKSTFLRQIALIVLLAQTGSYVPATDARVGLVDSIFCRVGASDNLARGESTFMVEMTETAHILRSATASSLLVLDEIGRGTSTEDGLAIAWAVSEYVLASIRAKTLFATHFHELTSLDKQGLANLSMEVVEEDGQIVFLKRVREGPSDESYGIHVAELAGVPQVVVDQAREILKTLRGLQGMRAMTDKQISRSRPITPPEPQHEQLTLFSLPEMICQEIHGLDTDNMTPLQALERLARWREELRKGTQ